jgi:hypothetical protein
LIGNRRRPGASLALKLSHPAPVTLLQKVYRGGKAAAMAAIGHAASLRSPAAKAAVKPIEADERAHREDLRIPPRRLRFPTIDLVGSAPSLATIA